MEAPEPTTGNFDQLLQEQPFELWKTPEPISSSLPPVEAFVPGLLPPALRGYVFDVAERQQSVPDFVAVAALCGLAALIGNRVRVAPKQNDDWLVVPNLWGAIVGAPSAMKSPAMKSALGPVFGLEEEMRKDWEADVKAQGVDDALRALEAKEVKKSAEKVYKSEGKDAARAILADVVPSGDAAATPCPRIVVNDATVEKLGELLNENPRGLLLVRDELPGFLSRMEREDFASDRAFYLEAFNGDGQFTYDRIGRGRVHIANCTLSLIGGVQPSRIGPIVKGALDGTTNDGLIQRLQLAVWPDARPEWKWVDRTPHRAFLEAYEQVFRGLHALESGSPEHPQVLRFCDLAQKMFVDWMTEIQTEARSGKLSPVLEAHILKMPKTVASLALIFELVEGGRFEIGETAMGMALGWAEYLRSHANRLYSCGNTMIEDGARLIIERRKQLPNEFTLRDIYRKEWAGLTDRELVAASVELLEKTNHCRPVEAAPKAAGGRSSVSYRWNPKIPAIKEAA